MKHTAKTIDRVMLTLLAIVAVAWLGLMAGLNSLLDYALKPAMKENGNASLSWQAAFDNYPELRPWHDSLVAAKALRDTFIASTKDGSLLHGYVIDAPAKTDSTAIVIHGYTDNAISMMMIGQMYNRCLGYNVILPDLRHSGKTPGSYVQMGWNDSRDILDWLAYARKRYGNDGFNVAHGISMGAATTMMTARFEGTRAGTAMPDAYIEDCGYTSVYDQFAKEMKAQFGLPPVPILDMASRLNKAERGWSFKEASAIDCIRRCNKPMMFIHGDADTYVPTSMAYRLYKAKPGMKELWIVPKAAHAVSYKNKPEEYTRRVADFLNKAALQTDYERIFGH